MRFLRDYKDGLLARFEGRKTLSGSELIAIFREAADYREKDLQRMFMVLEEIFEIPPGLLRPEDNVGKLTDRVPEKRWWRGPSHCVLAGDRQLWLQEEFSRRLRERGTESPEEIRTLGELAQYWCDTNST